MMSKSDMKMIEIIFNNIMLKDEFPKFGSPETRCDKCMFYNVVCWPAPRYVGCFHGWKKEKDD